MNWQHFRAFIWLRWRIRVNQLKRAGVANIVVMAIMAPALALAPVFLFAALFLVGLLAMPEAPGYAILLVWDGLVIGFLFSWATALMIDLQRPEVLSLDKFLHLPVSVKGVFLINYLSSLVSLNMAWFMPAMVGLCLGMAIGRGPATLVVLPLVAAFLWMITALTYQFQGWLASLMVNKRRRRTVVVIAVMVFVALAQIPNMITMAIPWDKKTRNQTASAMSKEDKEQQIRDETEELAQLEETIWIINLCLPIGWLPLGAEAAAQNDVVPAILGTLGLSLVGVLSLRRAFKTTLRLYTGHFTAGQVQRVVETGPRPKPAQPPSVAFLEKQLPLLSEQASAIAVTGFRALTRAPEAKMILLTPVIMVLAFGSLLLVRHADAPGEYLRPLIAFGGMGMVMLGMVGLVGNQFGFDRSGFRVFVLCAASRRDILLGKNLSMAPLGLLLTVVMAVGVEILFPMRLDHFLATFFQMISMYLLLCLLGNSLSIIAPMPIAAGSLKPANPKLIPILLQMVFVFLMPIIMAPTLLPLGLEVLLDYLEVLQGFPLCLLLSVVVCGMTVLAYWLILPWQGKFLHYREQWILEAVTTKAD